MLRYISFKTTRTAKTDMAALAPIQEETFDLDKNNEAIQGVSVFDDIG